MSYRGYGRGRPDSRPRDTGIWPTYGYGRGGYGRGGYPSSSRGGFGYRGNDEHNNGFQDGGQQNNEIKGKT